ELADDGEELRPVVEAEAGALRPAGHRADFVEELPDPDVEHAVPAGGRKGQKAPGPPGPNPPQTRQREPAPPPRPPGGGRGRRGGAGGGRACTRRGSFDRIRWMARGDFHRHTASSSAAVR